MGRVLLLMQQHLFFFKHFSTKLLTAIIKGSIISTIKFKSVTNNDCEGKKIRKGIHRESTFAGSR